MSNTFQPTIQVTPNQQMREHLAKHLTVNGQTPDAATIERVLRAKPKPAPKGDPATSRPFSLMR